MTAVYRRLLSSLLIAAAACNAQTGEPEHTEHGTSKPAAAQPSEHSGHVAPSSLPSGYAMIARDPAREAGSGLATAQVEERAFQRTIRTNGVVALDETGTAHVHSKVRGWIEQVSANFIGKQVRAGAPLCTIYSQEVYGAQLEFISVLEQTSGRAAGASAFAEVEKTASEKLLAAARRRLALWDVPPAEVERLERTRKPSRTFPIVAPRSGIVVSKQAIPGMFIDLGSELYVISDTAKLWVLADVYGNDLPWIKVGTPAKLSVEGLEAPLADIPIAFLPPTIEETTRTLKVRFELDNRDHRIRPGAFATVEMSIDLGPGLAVPESSVILNGDRAVAFVVDAKTITPRALELGPLVDGYYGVRSGLTRGESVATGAQFLIDSESRLRATSGPGAQHAGH
jgi:membrane fusion protein, copper/silver efflux system